MGSTHRPGSDRSVLGSLQRLRLAGRLSLGTPAGRRLGHRRRDRHRAGVGAAQPAHDDVRRTGRLTCRRPIESDLRHRASLRDRPPHRHEREPGRHGCAGCDLGWLASRVRQPQSRCSRPAMCCREHPGKCTPACAPPRWPATIRSDHRDTAAQHRSVSHVGLLIPRAPRDVFEALAGPPITRFWYSKSTGRIAAAMWATRRPGLRGKKQPAGKKQYRSDHFSPSGRNSP